MSTRIRAYATTFNGDAITFWYPGRGGTNPDIADALGIALRTVKPHRQRAMAKLGAYKTADLIRIADEADL